MNSKQTRDEQPTTNDDGKKLNNGPYDLYKIITETFETFSRCKHREVATRLIKISQEEIFFYEQSLDAIIVISLTKIILYNIIYCRKNQIFQKINQLHFVMEHLLSLN